MNSNRHVLLLFALTCCLLFSSMSQALASDEPALTPPDNLTAQGAVLLDMQSGRILFDRNKDSRLFPASITKIMTAMLALESGRLDDLVTTSQRAREQEGNRVYLEVGEQQTLENLLYGLMLNSGNDAAVAIAEHLAGSVEKFADLMNEKAAQLGARNTHFVTPSGLHDDNHYTTPYDMALISRAAMKHGKLREIAATQIYPWNGQVWKSELMNLNGMLWNYEGATGLKTGFTDQAQQTIVVTAKRGERELMAVLMGVQNKMLIRLESTALLDYGFDAFANTLVARNGDGITTYEDQGVQVRAEIREDIFLTAEQGDAPVVDRKIELTPPQPPYAAGAKVGTVTFTADGAPFAKSGLYAAGDVFPVPSPVEALAEPSTLYWLVPALLIGTLLLFGWRIRRRSRYQNRSSTR